MGAKTSEPAEAAAAGPGQTNSAGAGEMSSEVMSGVYKRFGQKPPAALQDQGKKPAAATATQATEKVTKPTEQPAKVPAPVETAATDESGAAGDEPAAGAPAGGEQPTGEDAPQAGAGEGGAAGDEPAAGGGEGEGAPQGDPAAGDPQTKVLREEMAAALHSKLKDLPEETRKTVQSFMDERIGQITAKARSENDRLGARVTELTGELDSVRKTGPVPVVIPGVHPALLADSTEQIDKHVDQLDEFEDWAETNREGFNLPESEGYDEKQPSYTGEQIRARLREVRRDRERVIPAARAKLTERAKVDEGLRAVLPAMFNAAAPEYAQAQAILKAQPHLRSRADQNLVIAQQILGQKALQQLQKRPAAAAKKPGDKAPNTGPRPAIAAPARRAPRAPGDGAPALGSPLDQPGQQPAADSAVKRFTKTGDRRDLVKAVGALVFR